MNGPVTKVVYTNNEGMFSFANLPVVNAPYVFTVESVDRPKNGTIILTPQQSVVNVGAITILE